MKSKIKNQVKDQISCSGYKLPYEIIKVIKQNIDYLIKHPKQLAWCLMYYENMHIACRMAGFETDNPKYIFIDYPEKDWPSLTAKQIDLLYAAWSINIADREISQDQIGPLATRFKMTLDDWVNQMTNPDYRYYDIYHGSRHSAVNHLLCVKSIYNNFWDKDGYLCEGRNNINKVIFYGFTLAEKDIPEEIRNNIFKIANDPRISTEIKKRIEEQKNFVQLTPRQQKEYIEQQFKSQFFQNISDTLKTQITELELKQNLEDRQRRKKHEWRKFYGINKLAMICNMPSNTHPSYIKEAMKIARLMVAGKTITSGYGPGATPEQCQDMERPLTKQEIEISQNIIDIWEPKGY